MNLGYTGGGYDPIGFNRPQQISLAIDFVEDDLAVERYPTLPGVMTFLINWNNKTIIVKERDSRGMFKPYRYFNFTEFFPQTQAPASQNSQSNVQNDSSVQNQLDELRSMIQQLVSKDDNNQNYNKNKKGAGNQ